MYRQLDAGKIIATAETLARRVLERFPESALADIAAEFVHLAQATATTADWLAAPHRGARLWVRGGLVVIGLIAAAALWTIDLRVEAFSSLSDLAQGVEAAIGDVVFIGIAVVFLLSAEMRFKRRRALGAIRELRAMAHIIDMHQLTKDPERLEGRGEATESSPERMLTPFELTRYLDYASEMLALDSKLAALLVQGFDDPVTLGAVNEIEELTAGMSRKIWQKITIVDRLLPGDAGVTR